MIKFTTKFPKFMQDLFNCKEEDTFTVSAINSKVQILHLGDQNIPICEFKVGYREITFIFVDTSGKLLLFKNGNVSPVLNEYMQETIPELLLNSIK